MRSHADEAIPAPHSLWLARIIVAGALLLVLSVCIAASSLLFTTSTSSSSSSFSSRHVSSVCRFTLRGLHVLSWLAGTIVRRASSTSDDSHELNIAARDTDALAAADAKRRAASSGSEIHEEGPSEAGGLPAHLLLSRNSREEIDACAGSWEEEGGLGEGAHGVRAHVASGGACGTQGMSREDVMLAELELPGAEMKKPSAAASVVAKVSGKLKTGVGGKRGRYARTATVESLD